MTFRTKLYTVFAVFALSLALTAPAFAQSTEEGYNPIGPSTLQEVDEGGNGGTTGNGGGPAGTTASNNPAGDPPSETRGTDGSTLPFTGLDVALLVGGGVLLLIMGVGMRRLTRAPSAA